MNLQLKPNDDTGLWEIHDECGHLCNLESESTAEGIIHAVNMLPKLIAALRHVLIASEDNGDMNDISWGMLRDVLNEAEQISPPIDTAGSDDQERIVRKVVGVIQRRNGGITRVFPSTQYGMGFILTDNNEIVFRDDSLTHDQRKQIAEKVNEITLPAG